jgi:hypothetical protein
VPGPQEHSCREAHLALEQAGFEPEVIKTHSYGALPMAVQTPSRKHVNDKTGSPWVPALETDDGEWISGTEEIVEGASGQPGQES